MHITRVRLTVPDAHATAAFLGEVLGLPSQTRAPGPPGSLRAPGSPGSPADVRVSVGSSRLDLTSDPGMTGHHHLAFLIPDTSFDAAKRVLLDRIPLLTADGHDEFEASASWNARSVYFEAPDGTDLELIARRDLPTPAVGTGPADVLSISEVGVAVADVPATTRALADEASVGLYGQHAPGADFAPVGTIDGMLILVGSGRAWFPTVDRIAREQSMTVHATGGLSRGVRARSADDAGHRAGLSRAARAGRVIPADLAVGQRCSSASSPTAIAAASRQSTRESGTVTV